MLVVISYLRVHMVREYTLLLCHVEVLVHGVRLNCFELISLVFGGEFFDGYVRVPRTIICSRIIQKIVFIVSIDRLQI